MSLVKLPMSKNPILQKIHLAALLLALLRPPQRPLGVLTIGSAPKISGAAALQLGNCSRGGEQLTGGEEAAALFHPAPFSAACWQHPLQLLLLLHLFGRVTVTPSSPPPSPVLRWESRSRCVLPGVAGGGLKAALSVHCCCCCCCSSASQTGPPSFAPCKSKPLGGFGL